MKHKIVPSLHSIIIIVICLTIAGSFIYLSTRELNKEVEFTSQTVDVDKMYNIWKNPEYKIKQIDVSFQYDTRQVDDVRVINYQVSENAGNDKITQKEIDVLLNCFRNDACEEIDISKMTETLVNEYDNYIVRDDAVIVYGLQPDVRSEALGEIENNIFVINEELFANIKNPIYSKTNEKYQKMRKRFLVENTDIEYNDFTNERRMTKKQEMLEEAVNEIKEEETINVKDDLKLLEQIANSISLLEKKSQEDN